MQKIPLPDFYYLDNFTQLLDHVFEYNKAVLREEDFDDFLNFKSLSKNAQALFTRFLMRKGNYFRPAKLSYKEIPNIDPEFMKYPLNSERLFISLNMSYEY